MSLQGSSSLPNQRQPSAQMLETEVWRQPPPKKAEVILNSLNEVIKYHAFASLLGLLPLPNPHVLLVKSPHRSQDSEALFRPALVRRRCHGGDPGSPNLVDGNLEQMGKQ